MARTRRHVDEEGCDAIPNADGLNDVVEVVYQSTASYEPLRSSGAIKSISNCL